MKNLYILQDINEEKLSELKEENADFIAFDYVSHEILAKNKIKHNLIDDYINENDRKEIFQFCSTCLKQYERSDESDLKFHNIDLVSIVDRNELHEFLMDLVPKIKAIKKTIEKYINKKRTLKVRYEVNPVEVSRTSVPNIFNYVFEIKAQTLNSSETQKYFVFFLI